MRPADTSFPSHGRNVSTSPRGGDRRNADAALRELKEETGCNAAIVGLIDVVDAVLARRSGEDAPWGHYVLVDYAARWTSGEPKAGDLFYRSKGPKDRDWSKPRRVNSDPDSAIALGNDRGGHLALGKSGTVHIAWNGSPEAKPRPADGAPMLYARLLPGADAFEPQKNLITRSGSLDGGGALATDTKGRVAVVWHAIPDDAPARNEAARRVFVATSDDDGKSFSPESPRSDAANGACGCCALQSAFTSQGDLLVLYRASIAVVHRDEHLLRIPAAGPVTDLKLDDWERPGCPMTTAAILPGLDRTLLAWESKGEIRWAPLTPKQTAPDKLTSAGTPAASKYHRAIGKPLDLGVLFTAIAGMLNLIAVIDAGFPTRRRLP